MFGNTNPGKPTFSFGTSPPSNTAGGGGLFKSLLGGLGGGGGGSGGGLFNFGGNAAGGVGGGLFGNNVSNPFSSILSPSAISTPAGAAAAGGGATTATPDAGKPKPKDRPTVLIVGTAANAFYLYWVLHQCGFDVKGVAHVTQEGCRVPPPLTGNNKANIEHLTAFYKNSKEAKRTVMDKTAVREAESFIRGCIDAFDLPKVKPVEEAVESEEKKTPEEAERRGTVPFSMTSPINPLAATTTPTTATATAKEGESGKEEEKLTDPPPPPDPLRGVKPVALRTLLTDLSAAGLLKKKQAKEAAHKAQEEGATPTAAATITGPAAGGRFSFSTSPSKRQMGGQKKQEQQQQLMAEIIPDTFFDSIDVVYIASPDLFNDRCRDGDQLAGLETRSNSLVDRMGQGGGERNNNNNRKNNKAFQNRFSNKKPVKGSVEEFIRACMERGKHVLVEPPVAPHSFAISRLMDTSTFKNNNKAKVVFMDRASSQWTDSSRIKFLKGLLGVNPPTMTPQKPPEGRGAAMGRARGRLSLRGRGRGRLSLMAAEASPALTAEQEKLKKLKVPSCKIGQLQRLQVQLCVPLSDTEKIPTATTVVPFHGGGVDLWFASKYSQYIEQKRVIDTTKDNNNEDKEASEGEEKRNKSTEREDETEDEDSPSGKRRGSDSMNASVTSATSQLSSANSLSEMLTRNNPHQSSAPHVEKSRLLYGVLGDVGWYVMAHYLSLFDWAMPASVRARVLSRHPISKSPSVVEGELYFFIDFDQYNAETKEAALGQGKGKKKGKAAATPKKETTKKNLGTSTGGGNFVRIMDTAEMSRHTIVAAYFYISNEGDGALVQDFSASGSEGQVLVSDLVFPRVEGDELTDTHKGEEQGDLAESDDEDSDLELSGPETSENEATPSSSPVPTSRSPKDSDLPIATSPSHGAPVSPTAAAPSDSDKEGAPSSSSPESPTQPSEEETVKKLPKVCSTYTLVTMENAISPTGAPQRQRRERVCAFPPEEYADVRLAVKLRQLLQNQKLSAEEAAGGRTSAPNSARFGGTSPSKFGRRPSLQNKNNNTANANNAAAGLKDQSHPSRFPVTNPEEAMTYMTRLWKVQRVVECLYESAEREAFTREQEAASLRMETSQSVSRGLEERMNYDAL